MAIYHCSVKTLSRSDNRSAVAAAAYRAAQILTDERTGAVHDYTRKGGVKDAFILAPEGAPAWIQDRAMLWNAAEHSETRKNSRVAREVVLALPNELTEGGRQALARKFAEWLVGEYGVACDVAIHAPHREGDNRNHHAHILFTTRSIDAGGFGKKTRILDDRKTGPEQILRIRRSWETFANLYLKRAGSEARIDHRSHKARGFDVPPQIHVGVNAKGMERRGAKPRSSVIQVDFKGREVRYPEIDKGRTRTEYNAEIIELQNYRAQAAPRQQGPPDMRQRILEMEARALAMSGDIATLEASLDSALLSEDVRVRIRLKIERAMAKLLRRQLDQTAWQQRRKAELEKAAEIQRKTEQQRQLFDQARGLKEQYQAQQVRLSQNRELFVQANRMSVRLNGMPPYKIKMEVSKLAAQFDERSFRDRVGAQRTAALDKRVIANVRPPPEAQKKAVVHLRQETLQVKELLSRAKKPAQKAPEQRRVVRTRFTR